MKINIIWILFIIVIIASCQIDDDDNVVVKTISFEEDGEGFIQFYTNDSEYYNYSFSCAYTNTEDPMDTVNITLKKMSGYASAGYGIIFCHQDWDIYYRLLISVNGLFQLTKQVSNVNSTLIDWIFSGDINTGYNVENVINVTYDDPTNTFSISFNDGEGINCIDSSFSAGKAGFFAAIGDNTMENFPDTPVDIRYKMNTPITVP